MTTWYPMTWSTAHHWGHVPTLASVVKKNYLWTTKPWNMFFFQPPKNMGYNYPPQKIRSVGTFLWYLGIQNTPWKSLGFPKAWASELSWLSAWLPLSSSSLEDETIWKVSVSLVSTLSMSCDTTQKLGRSWCANPNWTPWVLVGKRSCLGELTCKNRDLTWSVNHLKHQTGCAPSNHTTLNLQLKIAIGLNTLFKSAIVICPRVACSKTSSLASVRSTPNIAMISVCPRPTVPKKTRAVKENYKYWI